MPKISYRSDHFVLDLCLKILSMKSKKYPSRVQKKKLKIVVAKTCIMSFKKKKSYLSLTGTINSWTDTAIIFQDNLYLSVILIVHYRLEPTCFLFPSFPLFFPSALCMFSLLGGWAFIRHLELIGLQNSLDSMEAARNCSEPEREQQVKWFIYFFHL